jgi:hypothetical protein
VADLRQWSSCNTLSVRRRDSDRWGRGDVISFITYDSSPSKITSKKPTSLQNLTAQRATIASAIHASALWNRTMQRAPIKSPLLFLTTILSPKQPFFELMAASQFTFIWSFKVGFHACCIITGGAAVNSDASWSRLEHRMNSSKAIVAPASMLDGEEKIRPKIKEFLLMIMLVTRSIKKRFEDWLLKSLLREYYKWS